MAFSSANETNRTVLLRNRDEIAFRWNIMHYESELVIANSEWLTSTFSH